MYRSRIARFLTGLTMVLMGLVGGGMGGIVGGAEGKSGKEYYGEADPAREKGAAAIRELLSEAERDGLSEEVRRGAYERGAREALKLVEGNVLLTEMFQGALEKAEKEPQRGEKVLRETLRLGVEVLEFRVLKEAELPVGFPEPTPVGEIRVKQYPAYRMASARQSLGETLAFWTLFGHIQRNSIAMTAPVEMTFGESEKDQGRVKSMAFLYGSQEIGQTGKDGSVEVIDVKPLMTVSLGMRGEAEDRGRDKARRLLERWLQEQEGKYRATGGIRMLGYNSPQVPSAKRYFEFEIPVERVGE